ncbi:MAG: hydrolase, partial [Actinomycetota bacterium]|nr:hydrolase [Actinomycetota bacterium]
MASGLLTASFSLVVALSAAGMAGAVPPPPPNPSDSELDSSRSAARSKAGKVGELTNQLAQAEARLMDLRAEV